MSKIKYIIAVVLVITLMISGCSKKIYKTDESMVYITKENSVVGAIIEKFDKSYYSNDELKAFVENEIDAYNSEAGDEKAITITKFEVEDQVATLFMKYKTVEDYTTYNDTELYSNKVTKAVKDGIAFDGTFIKVSNQTKVKKKEFVKNEKLRVVVLKGQAKVEVDGKILYVSKNVNVEARDIAVTAADEDNYIIYK